MSSPERAFDVVVIGGGIIGCAVAFELTSRGMRVALLERQQLAVGASGAAAGMLAPQSEAHQADDWFRLMLEARNGYASLSEQLVAETGIDIEYRQDGVLRIALTPEQRDEYRERGRWQLETGLAAEWLDPDSARLFEPALTPQSLGCLWLPDEAHVRSQRVVHALGAAASRRGLDLREGETVLEVEHSHGRVTAVRTVGGRFTAGAAVVATGAWTEQLRGLSVLVPVQPAKGQMVSALHSGAGAPRHIVWGSNAYVVPKVGGELFVGSTQEPGFDARPTLGGISSLIAAGTSLVPGLATMPLGDTWAGLRPATPDGLPVLGPSPDVEGLFFATGHYRNGILLGPLTGKLMAQMIAGDSPDVDLAAYSVERFAAARAQEAKPAG